MASIAVVILNWNGRSLLERFLPSVIAHSEGAKIVVADNGSSDDSLDWLKTNYPQVQTLAFPENLGFCGGYNRAIAEVAADTVVLLNSDVEVTEGWLKAPMKWLAEDPKLAALQPKIRSASFPEYFEYAGAAGGFLDMLGYPFCRGRMFFTAEVDEGQYDDACEVLWATGACLFIRRELFLKSGGLDERFFAHMEEIDLCWRLKNAGWKIGYTPESTVFHLGGGTLPKSNPRKTYYNFRNGLAMMIKNLPLFRLLIVLWVRFHLDMLAALQFFFSGFRKDAREVLRAYWHIYSRLGRWSKARSAVREFAKPRRHPQILRTSIVWNYYLRKRKSYRAIFGPKAGS